MNIEVAPLEGSILSACPVCGSAALLPFRSGVDYHYGIPGSFSSDRCTACGLVFLNPMPSVRQLAKFYPDDYYSFESPELDRRWRRRVARALGLIKTTYLPHFARPGRALDLGCGAGHYLVRLREMGWEVRGSELSRGAAEAGRRAGLDIRSGELMDAGFADAEFDFVRANHSFEHIPNPHEVLKEIHRILKPGGTLFIGVPNIDSVWARMFGEHWWNFCLPVHVFNYNSKNIRLILENEGFRVIQVRFNSDFGSSLGSLQIRRNARKGLRSSDGPLLRNKPAVVLGHVAAKLSDWLRRGDCIEVIATRD